MPEVDQRNANQLLDDSIEVQDGSAFLQAAESMHYADLAAVYEGLDEDREREFFLKTLSPERFSEVLPELPEKFVEESLNQFQPSQQREILEAIPDDDRVDILQDVSDEARGRFLGLLEKDEEELTRTLLNYEEDTAGGRMTTQIGRIDDHLLIREALDALHSELEDTEIGVHCLCPNLVSTKIFQSERNRDDGVEMKASQTATIGVLREAVSSMGISVDQVAGDIIDALRANQFWIFTHELTRKALSARFADIEADRNPTNPYEGRGELDEITELQ